MIKKDSKSAWTRGRPLSEAWLEMMDEVYPEYKFPEILKALRKPGKGQQLYWKEFSIRMDFLAWLESGYVIAIGYRVRPMVEDRPVEIPKAVFQSFGGSPKAIDWEHDQVQSGETLYADVRVVLADETAAASNGKRAGRPRKRDHLEKAAMIAKERDPDFCTKARKLGVEDVREMLKIMPEVENPEEVGSSEKTIAKAIVVVCRAADDSK